MPSKVIKRGVTNVAPEVLNAVRNSATQNYRNYVPYAADDGSNLKEIGVIIMENPALRNEFLSTIANRISFTMIQSKMWDNPLGMFTKGKLEWGETVEDIFVDIAKVFQYDPEDAEQTFMKREKPNVATEFFVMNSQVFYKTTTEDVTLRAAFTGNDGMMRLIQGIATAMYKSANYDAYQTIKYLLARRILSGQVKTVGFTSGDMKDLVTKVKAESNNFTFLRNDSNIAKVYNATEKENQYILIDTNVDSSVDVEVLAAAFNMDKVTFAGHKVLVDGFGNLDNSRLDVLLGNNENYVPISAADQALLNTIPAVMVDENFFMIFDKLFEMHSETFNQDGLYRQHTLHNWRIYATSAFSNNAVFVPGTPSITSVTASPDAVSIANGTPSVQLGVVVVTSNFASQAVNWTVDSTSAAAGVTVDSRGKVTIPSTVKDAEITVTVTSAVDATKSDDAVITVGTPT
jgi:hypothetical protein